MTRYLIFVSIIRTKKTSTTLFYQLEDFVEVEIRRIVNVVPESGNSAGQEVAVLTRIERTRRIDVR
jgi:hypothetical protein